MLSPDRVKPFLMHKDDSVRHAAIEYLQPIADRAQVTADDIWAIIDLYGAGLYNGMLSRLSHFPQTDSSIKRALQDKLTKGDEALGLIVSTMDLGLLRQYAGEFTDPSSHVATYAIKERLRLGSLSADDVWSEVEKFAAETTEENYSDETIDTQERLVEAVYHHASKLGDRVLKLLQSSKFGDFAWDIASECAGKLKLTDAIDPMLDVLEIDDDSVDVQRVSEALESFQNGEVVRRIAVRLPGASKTFRTEVAGLLGKFRISEAEDVLEQMLANETDREPRGFIAHALVEELTDRPAVWKRLQQMAEHLDYDRTIFDFRSTLPAFATITGMSLPEAARWQAEDAQRRGERRATNLKMMNLDDLEPDEISRPEPPVTPKPIVRNTAKVGRNDPCPCGSGKKYKKCCLR